MLILVDIFEKVRKQKIKINKFKLVNEYFMTFK